MLLFQVGSKDSAIRALGYLRRRHMAFEARDLGPGLRGRAQELEPTPWPTERACERRLRAIASRL